MQNTLNETVRSRTGKAYRSLEQKFLFKSDALTAMMEQSHYERVAQLIRKDGISYRTFFRRHRNGQQRAEVRRDDLSGCLRTAVGGSGRQFLIEAGNGRIKMRTMTPREYARLQGVHDEYPIASRIVQALTGFGDAVCAPVITWIGQNILNPLIEKHLSGYRRLSKENAGS